MGAQASAKAARKAARQTGERLPPWTPFVRATPYMSPEKREGTIRDTLAIAEREGWGASRSDIEAMIDSKLEQEMYQNSRYVVIVIRDEPQDPDCPKMIHLSIRRNDRERPQGERYRDFQRIKSELVGPDHEGVELYPSEARVVDSANQYHLYVLADPDAQFGFGFTTGLRSGPGDGPAVQHPFDE